MSDQQLMMFMDDIERAIRLARQNGMSILRARIHPLQHEALIGSRRVQASLGPDGKDEIRCNNVLLVADRGVPPWNYVIDPA